MTEVLIKFTAGDYRNPDAIEKTVAYIFRTGTKRPLPVFCYGAFPPTYDGIVSQFKETRAVQSGISDRHVWHFILSFPDNTTLPRNRMFSFADEIAKIFCMEYQVCYAYHSDTDHPHFHYIVSATGYMPENILLDEDRMTVFLGKMTEPAKRYNISLSQKQ